MYCNNRIVYFLSIMIFKFDFKLNPLKANLLPVISIGIAFLFASGVPEAFAQSRAEFSEQEISAIIAHGPWPEAVPPDPANELSGLRWAEKLGESLFSDTTLSANQSVSCASCHQPENGFTDKLSVGVGLEKGVRNTQGLLDIGLQRWFGWDGGADSLWAASLRPMFNAHEMGNDITSLANTLRSNEMLLTALQSNYIDHSTTDISNNDIQTNNTSADENKPIVNLSDEELVVVAAKSIAAFMRTLRSERSEFDRYRDALANDDVKAQASYSESAKRGLKIFIGEANCRVCHFGSNFSNGEFHDTGRPFFTEVGVVDSGRYGGIKRVKQDRFNLLSQYGETSSHNDKLKTKDVKLSQLNWGQWRTPSLRNLDLTGPYMHDGSLETLRDVVDAYADIDPDRLHAEGEAILRPLDLNDDQRNDLVNFLRSLSLKQ